MNEVELEELRRDREYEAKENADEESKLHNDYFYAEEQLLVAQLSDAHDDLMQIIVSMESYGWEVDIEYLTDLLKDM